MKQPAHPPMYRGRADFPQRDHLSKAGAQKLAATIRQAWARIGVEIVTVVEPIAAHERKGGGYAVRTPQLVNGLFRP